MRLTPTVAQYFDKIEVGDLMLYGSNCLVLFYGAVGGYPYTRISKLTSTDGLAKAAGNGAATVTFEKPAYRFFRLVATGSKNAAFEVSLRTGEMIYY